MCNLYSITKGQQAIIAATRAMVDRTGNLPPLPGVFPDYAAPIVRNGPDGRELVMARWGMPTSSQVLLEAARKRAQKLQARGLPIDFQALLRMEPDSGLTNIRNTVLAHWRPWLGPENRCVVPVASFSEFNRDAGGDIWFALDESRPLAFFAAAVAIGIRLVVVAIGVVGADRKAQIGPAPALGGIVEPSARTTPTTQTARQIPIGRGSPVRALPSRGFVPWRLSDTGRTQPIQRDRPASETLHNSYRWLVATYRTFSRPMPIR